MLPPNLAVLFLRGGGYGPGLRLAPDQEPWAEALLGLVIVAVAAWALNNGFRGGGFRLIRRSRYRVTKAAPQLFWTLAMLHIGFAVMGLAGVFWGLYGVFLWTTR